MNTLRRQSGYLLVTMVVTLFLVASIALLLNYDSVISANTTTGGQDAARADYLAEAGTQHALWWAGNNACKGDVTIPTTTLGLDSYAATLSGAASGTFFSLAADQDAWIRSDDITKNNGTTVSNHVRSQTGNIERILTRFDLSSLPANAQINSAVAWFNLRAGMSHPQGPITVHEVTADWAEATVTWESFADRFRTERLGMIPAQGAGDVWVAINLTGQVQAWINGEPNHGILFDTQAEGVHTEYMAREDNGNPPRLEVVVGSGPTTPLQIQATGTLASGVDRSLGRSAVRAYQAPSGFEASSGAGQGKDTFLRENQEYTNHGADAELWVREATGGNGDNSLLKFDLQGFPGSSRVLNATLSLYQFDAATPGGTIAVHRLTRDWDEGNNTGSAGNSSWRTHGFFQWWSRPGGDFDPTPAAATVIAPGSVGWHTWDISKLADGWANGTNPNHGLILTSASAGTEAAFASSDDPDASLHPRLTISYACECGSACLAAQGSGNVLMVIGNSTWNPSDEEKDIRAYLERWGYTVSLIRDSDGQAAYDGAIAANDVVFVSATANSSNVSTKLTSTTVGVVTAQRDLNDELGIATLAGTPVNDTIDIVDSSHYITAVFPTAPLKFKLASTELATVSGTLAPDAHVLAQVGSAGSVVALESGASSSGGGTVAGRRVLVPLGAGDASWNYLTNNGQLVVQRALQWGTGNSGPVIGIPIFLSTDSPATLGGLTFDDVDLVEYDPTNHSASLFLEGGLTTLTSDIDALHVLANGHIVMSTKADGIFGGLKFMDGSLIDYDPATDEATLYIDEGVFNDDENIVSVYVMEDGHILLSTDSDATLGGLSFTDSDLVEYDPDSDSATLFFDGSTTTLTSDIDAVHLLANGHIILSTKGSGSLGGLSFDDGDLVDYDPLADTAVLYFDEGLFTGDGDLISTHIGPGSGKAIPRKKVYWTDDNAGLIQRSNEDGSNIETLVSGQTNVRGLDLDTVDGKLYWTSDDDIRRANLDGSNIETVFSGTLVNLDIKLDVPAGKMYWSHDNGNDQVMRANLDGSNSETINSSLGSPAYMTLDTAAGYIYITEFAVGNVSRMNLDGSSSTTLITGPDGAVGNALDPVGGKIYWSGGASYDWIKRADLDGSNEETIVTGLNAPQDIVYDADNDRIYWTDALVIPSIKRANADGSNVETIVTGLNRPRSITLVNAGLLLPTGGGGGGGGGDDTYRDEFNARNYSGSDGTLIWGTDWLEVGENDGATSGDEQVRSDGDFDFVLRVRDNNNSGEGVQREADLSACSSAKFSFDYRRKSFDNSSDYVTIDVSSNGGSSWSELDRLSGPADESAYRSISYSLAAHTATNTRIRFLTSPDLGGTDEFLVDNVEITCTP